MKLLIVDDVMSNRQLLVHILKDYGVCDEAVNGLEALEMVIAAYGENSPYDAIFLDIMMPEMDGMEALREIRTWEKNNKFGEKPVKVIMATTLGDWDHIIASFRDGCEEYMVKPFTRSKIIGVLNKLHLVDG